MISVRRFAVVIASLPMVAVAQPSSSPDTLTPAQRLQALKASPAVERREQTTVAVAADAALAERTREAALADIIRDYELHNSAEPGTVVHFKGATRDYLALDLVKSLRAAQGGGNKMFSAAGIGGQSGGAGTGPKATLMPATVEYKSNETFGLATESVTAFTAAAGTAVAGRAAKTADAPVSLNIDTANVSAVQVADGAAGLTMPVAVTIGGQTQTLKPGQTGTFGDLEVEIESSVNYSSIPAGQREGAPFGLSLRVRSVSTAGANR